MHGTVWETDGLRVEEVHVAPGTRLRGHGHDHPHLCYIETGAFAERDVGGWRSVAGGTLRSSPAGDEHDIRFETNTTCLLVLFEGAPLAASPAFPGSRHYSEQPRVRELGGALARSLHRAPLSTFEIGTVALELLAAGCPTTTPRTPPPWLHRVRERLLDDPARPPDTTELAEVTGVHPVYVARAFRSHYGVGLGEFARIARAERARA